MASNLSSEELARAAYSLEDLLSPQLLQRLEDRVLLAKEDIQKKKAMLREGIAEMKEMLDKKEAELVSYLDTVSDKIDQTVKDTKENIRLIELGKREMNTKFETADTSKETNSIFQLIDSNLASLKYSLLILPEVHLSWTEDPEFDTFLRQLCRIEINQHVYTFRNTPLWSTEVRGDMFNYPMSLGLRGGNEDIFIADHLADQIKVFNNKGEFINFISDNDMTRPNSIQLYRDTAVVVCDNSIFKFSTDTLEKLHSIESNQTLRGVAIDSLREEIFVCERYVIKINAYDLKLNCIRSFDLKIDYEMEADAIRVRDMRFVNKELYVLFAEASVTLRTFNGLGNPLRSILYKDQIENAYFFTVDSWNNILVCDSKTGSVLVCTNDGFELGEIEPANLKGKAKWMPQGIALDRDFNVIVVGDNENDVIQAF